MLILAGTYWEDRVITLGHYNRIIADISGDVAGGRGVRDVDTVALSYFFHLFAEACRKDKLS